jgi:hypothetical protein
MLRLEWAPHTVEQELLQFDDFRPSAAASLPPSIGVKIGIARGLHFGVCRMTLHDPVENASQSSGVILSRHHHHGLEMLLIGPWRKRLTFISSSVDFGDVHDIRYAERLQLAKLPCPCILVWKPSASKLLLFSVRRLIKNRNALRDAALHEICRSERPGGARVEGQDDDVGRGDRFLVNDEGPACGSQDRLASRTNGDDRNCDQRQRRNYGGPSRPPKEPSSLHKLGCAVPA